MKEKRSIGIIRQRGQLTIPDSIRKAVGWLKPETVVDVSVTTPEEITIRPYEGKHKANHQELWDEINAIRSLPGQAGNLSEFIDHDRQTRDRRR